MSAAQQQQEFFLSHGILENQRVDERSTPGERVLRGMCPRPVVERALGRALTVAQYESIMDQYALRFHPIPRADAAHFIDFARNVARIPPAQHTYTGNYSRHPACMSGGWAYPEQTRDEPDSFEFMAPRRRF
jgi:hypothetical protein